MPNLNAYLTFDGTCAEAMRFYENVLGGKMQSMMTFGESPMAAETPPAQANRIMHASLLVGDNALMASDSMPGHPYPGMHGFSLSLNYPTTAAARVVYEALTSGGKVIMPLQKTFWAEGFAMLVDRFGVPWMINVDAPRA